MPRAIICSPQGSANLKRASQTGTTYDSDIVGPGMDNVGFNRQMNQSAVSGISRDTEESSGQHPMKHACVEI